MSVAKTLLLASLQVPEMAWWREPLCDVAEPSDFASGENA